MRRAVAAVAAKYGMTTTQTRAKLVIGNWKMHGSLSGNVQLLTALRGYAGQTELAVCVPFPYLAQASQVLEGTMVGWGAQDVSAQASGAYTGEVAASMLADFGSRWVLVGHSERRTHHGETDAQVAAKVLAAQAAGMTPVVCIGETLQQHEDGHVQQVIRQQLQPVLALGADVVAGLVVAYEPVWAIGTGRSATPDQAQDVHAMIRAMLAELAPSLGAQTRILYGGSVNAGNAANLFAMPDIDGALVGGASLQAQEFLRIAAA